MKARAIQCAAVGPRSLRLGGLGGKGRNDNGRGCDLSAEPKVLKFR
jgi:hypothetical protein